MNAKINLFHNKKSSEKISMITCYDYSTAVWISKTDIDAILVGDSLGMVFQGHDTTLSVTVDEMIYHSKTVRRGAPDKFLVVDLPFLSYHVSVEDAVRNAGRVIKETGAEAVKIEGGAEIIDKVNALIAAKIPVLGHLGLTPQSVNLFGGYKIQGKNLETAKAIVRDALLLEKAGVFAVVLEGIPEKLADYITSKLSIPTIGIGAGRNTDGQILVVHDILGLYEGLSPKFVKRYGELGTEVKNCIQQYSTEVKNRQFPDESHCFKMDESVYEELLKE